MAGRLAANLAGKRDHCNGYCCAGLRVLGGVDMSDEELRAADDHNHRLAVRQEIIHRLANRIELEILADHETFTEHVLDKDDFINTLSALVYTMRDDNAELGMYVRALYRDEAKKAADWEAERRIDNELEGKL